MKVLEVLASEGIPIVEGRCGVLAGSFDPAHKGHVGISLAVKETFGLSWILWCVTPRNPLKEEPPGLLFEERVRRARLLVEGEERIYVSGLEKLCGYGYSVETVRGLKESGLAFVWIMGGDTVGVAHCFYCAETFLSLCCIVGVSRGSSGVRSPLYRSLLSWPYGKVYEGLFPPIGKRGLMLTGVNFSVSSREIRGYKGMV